MAETEGEGRRWLKIGCVGIVVLLLVVAAGIGTTIVVALRQIDADTPEIEQIARHVPEQAAATAELEPQPAPVRLELDVSVAQVLLVPAETGQSIDITAKYDRRRYRLEQHPEQLGDGSWVYRVELVPIGSPLLALLKMKLGGAPPELRIELPRDVELAIGGQLYATFAAMELGGLQVDSVDFQIEGSAAVVSFVEPTAAPMRRLSLIGEKGSIEVTGLGNASPETVIIEQRLGEIDLDFRGLWLRDAEIHLSAELAAGGLWLPDNAIVEGIPRRLGQSPPAGEELPLPRLQFTVATTGGKLIFLD